MSENSFIQLYTINLPKYFMCMECLQETFSLFVMAFDANRLKNMTYCVIVGNLYYRVMHSSFMEDFQNYNIYR